MAIIAKNLGNGQDSSNKILTQECCHCYELNTLHRHGSYPRKVRGKIIMIARYFCYKCKCTCSRLPEDIAPRRWYPWGSQESVLEDRLEGKSWVLISDKCKASINTCRRWYNRFKELFLVQADALRNNFAINLLGPCNFKSFWSRCLAEMKLSRAMYLCNSVGVSTV